MYIHSAGRFKFESKHFTVNCCRTSYFWNNNKIFYG